VLHRLRFVNDLANFGLMLHLRAEARQ
jgi:hypothetical protein